MRKSNKFSSKSLIKKKIVQAVIFCGGFGTRVKKITKKIPKPLYKINGKEFLTYLIENIIRYGIEEILLLCHYKSFLFQKVAKKISNSGLRVRVIHEKYPRGSGGALINAKKYLKKKFYIFNGDTYFDFNYLDLQLSLNNKFVSTIAVLKDTYKKNGQIILDKDKKIIYFNKKAKTRLLNSGVGILDKNILKYFKFLKKKKFYFT